MGKHLEMAPYGNKKLYLRYVDGFIWKYQAEVR